MLYPRCSIAIIQRWYNIIQRIDFVVSNTIFSCVVDGVAGVSRLKQYIVRSIYVKGIIMVLCCLNGHLIDVNIRKPVGIVMCHLIVFRRTDECYKLWLFKVNRRSVTDSARICSEHFISGMYENLTLIITSVYSSRHRSSFCSKLFFQRFVFFNASDRDIGNKSWSSCHVARWWTNSGVFYMV